MHGAAEWLLRRWGHAEQIAAIDMELQQTEGQLRNSGDSHRQWYINGQGQTFVILQAGEFQMGSLNSEAGRNAEEYLHQRHIGRRFAISTKEVTKEQWREFGTMAELWTTDHVYDESYVRTEDSPVVGMQLWEAAWYCNWLSEQEGISEDQWCYEPNPRGVFGVGMKPKENFLELSGYRLPREAEWEFACRAGATTSRYYGQSDTLLPEYAWYLFNSENRTYPVASLMPNDFGLFDMLGNIQEWCQDIKQPYQRQMTEDPAAMVQSTTPWTARGSAFGGRPETVRSAQRGGALPGYRGYGVGFRPARTLPAVRDAESP